MEKQFLVTIECEENEPDVVTATGLDVTVEQWMSGFNELMVEPDWTVKVEEVK